MLTFLLTLATVDPTADLSTFLALAADLWQGARWAPLVALGVVGVVYLARRWGSSVLPWLGTRYGGLTLVGLAALAGSALEQMLGGGGLTAQVVINAIVAAVGAIGAHSALKNTVQGQGSRP